MRSWAADSLGGGWRYTRTQRSLNAGGLPIPRRHLYFGLKLLHSDVQELGYAKLLLTPAAAVTKRQLMLVLHLSEIKCPEETLGLFLQEHTR